MFLLPLNAQRQISHINPLSALDGDYQTARSMPSSRIDSLTILALVVIWLIFMVVTPWYG